MSLLTRMKFWFLLNVLEHLKNVDTLLGKLLEEAATLERLEIHGPKSEVDKLIELGSFNFFDT